MILEQHVCYEKLKEKQGGDGYDLQLGSTQCTVFE